MKQFQRSNWSRETDYEWWRLNAAQPASSRGTEVKWSHSVVSNSLRPHVRQPTRLLCPWDFPGKSAGVGCHCLLQGIFLTQGLNIWARASFGSLNSSVLVCWPYCASSTQTLLGNTWTLHQTERSSLGPALWPRQVTLPPEALVSSSLSIRLTVVLTSWDNVRIQLYDTQKMSQRSRRVEYLKSNSHFYSSHCAWCRNIADKDSSCFTPL